MCLWQSCNQPVPDDGWLLYKLIAIGLKPGAQSTSIQMHSNSNAHGNSPSISNYFYYI